MGDKITNAVAGVMPDVSNLDIVGMLKEKLFSIIPPSWMQLYTAHQVLVTLGLICVLLLLAVKGYKIFKTVLYAGGAFAFAYLGYTFVAPKLPATVTSFVPASLNTNVIVAVLLALIAVFLTRCAYNFMIMVLGGVAGYFLGASVIYGLIVKHFHTLTFLQIPAVKYIIGAVFSAMFAILFILLFKHLFIILTSLACPVAAAALLKTIVMPTGSSVILGAFAVVGIAFGIFCIVHQYKQEEKDMEIVF